MRLDVSFSAAACLISPPAAVCKSFEHEWVTGTYFAFDALPAETVDPFLHVLRFDLDWICIWLMLPNWKVI